MMDFQWLQKYEYESIYRKIIELLSNKQGYEVMLSLASLLNYLFAIFIVLCKKM